MICVGMIKIMSDFLFSKQTENRKSNENEKRDANVKDLARSILGVPQNTSVKDVKKAYISLIKEFHPDNYSTANYYLKMEMEEKSKLINWAYSELKITTA
jgi:DnaJ-class molecular chaperone